MAIDFPNTPANGETYTVNNRSWVYNSSLSSWEGGLSTVIGNLVSQNANAVNITGGTISNLTSLSVTGNLTVDTNTLFVDSVNNRVGVGTVSPTSTLTIKSKNANDLVWDALYSSNSNPLFRLSEIGGTRSQMTQYSSGGGAVNRFDTGGVNYMIGGNLGIGSTTPNEKLTVVGNISATGSVTALSANITGNLVVDTNTLFVDSANNRVGVGTISPATPLEVMGIIRANSGVFNLNMDAAAGSFSGSGNISFISGAADKHIYFAAGSLSNIRITVLGGGNVGIGSTTPNEKLTVVGNISATGSVTALSANITGDTVIGGTLGVTGNTTVAGLTGTNATFTDFSRNVTLIDDTYAVNVTGNSSFAGTVSWDVPSYWGGALAGPGGAVYAYDSNSHYAYLANGGSAFYGYDGGGNNAYIADGSSAVYGYDANGNNAYLANGSSAFYGYDFNGNTVYIADNNSALYASNGAGNGVNLASGTSSVYAYDVNGNTVYIADGSNAFYAYNSSSYSVSMCNSTYALDVSGPINTYDPGSAQAGTGYTGPLNDSSSTQIADVINGLIVGTYY